MSGTAPVDRSSDSPGLSATIALAALAIAAFAGNSLIARFALADGAIDAASYSLIRLGAGALVLLPLLLRGGAVFAWRGGAMLACYVITFSFAYVVLPAALGALILFACVQATIVATGLLRGERLTRGGLLGLVLSLCGLVVLVAPTITDGDWWAAALMAISGMAWGIYTMTGRGADNSAMFTASSFVLASILVLPLLWAVPAWPSVGGVALAALSGAVTSGAGYVVWNLVSPRLGLATLATVQLATPLVTALGGVALLGEAITVSLTVAGALIMVGIALTLKR